MSFRNFRSEGKLGLVEFTGASSTRKIKAPKFENVNYDVNRISTDFCYYGTIDNKSCIFKLDTGSDVTILNSKMVSLPRQRIPVSNCKLRYPTGEEIEIKFKVNVWISLGKYSMDFSMLVANINDD